MALKLYILLRAVIVSFSLSSNMGYIIVIRVYLAFLSGDVDKKMLDTLRQMETSELRRCGGEEYSQHLGPRAQSGK